MLYRIVTVSNQCWIRDWGSYGTTWNFKLPSYLKVCTMRYARHPFDIFIPADIIFNHSSLQFSCSDCFFHSSELHFAQADYLQALEMDPENQAVKSRLSIVYNEFGILDYYDRHYLESIDHLTAAIRFNPRIAAYYLSRARARYMIEVRETQTVLCDTISNAIARIKCSVFSHRIQTAPETTCSCLLTWTPTTRNSSRYFHDCFLEEL